MVLGSRPLPDQGRVWKAARPATVPIERGCIGATTDLLALDGCAYVSRVSDVACIKSGVQMDVLRSKTG